MNVKIVIDFTVDNNADPEMVGEAAFDLLCSVGENPDVCERFDALVHTVDGFYIVR